jgi:hypothetical protein
MSVTAPNIPTVEPFDLSNEERSQQAFQARLKELKEAMVTGAAGKGNGSPVVQGARGPVVKRENFSPAKFVSATAIEAQPSAAQQAETHLLISKADLDSIVQLLSETRLSIKDENDETQQVSYDIVMSNLEDVHTKCDAFLAAMLEVQDGVGNAKAAFNELVEAQNHATEASRAKWAVLASQFDSVLDNVETSLRKACIQVPRTNEIAPEQDTVDGDFNKEHVINGEANKKNDDAIVEKELDSTPVKKVEVAVVLEPKEPMKAGAAVAKQPAPKPELNLDGTWPLDYCAKLTKHSDTRAPSDPDQLACRSGAQGHLRPRLGWPSAKSPIQQGRPHVRSALPHHRLVQVVLSFGGGWNSVDQGPHTADNHRVCRGAGAERLRGWSCGDQGFSLRSNHGHAQEPYPSGHQERGVRRQQGCRADPDWKVRPCE